MNVKKDKKDKQSKATERAAEIQLGQTNKQKRGLEQISRKVPKKFELQ